MAFVYEVNGQRIEFEKEPSEKDIDEAARSLKGAPQTARPRPVEGSGGAAFGVYPQAGRRPESQQDRVASQDMALQTARGVASNVPAVLGIPGTVINTVANLPRTAQDIQNRYQRVVTGSDAPLPELPPYNQVAPYDMNYFGQLVPGPEPTSPAGQLAFAGGQVVGAPVMAKTIQTAAQVPGQVMNTARELRTGATEGLRNPTYQSNATTAFQPLKETYYPTPEVQRFQAMPPAQRPAALPALEASQQPSASLFQSPGQLLARNLGPTAAGETLIPLQGRTARAFGEQIARDVSNRPFTAGGVGLGGAALGGLFGGPIGALAGAALAPGMRFAQLAAMNKLSQTAGFAPGFTEQLAAARGRAGIQSGMPTTPALGYTPPGGGGGGGGGGVAAPGPVNPATMYAGSGGVSADLGTAGAAALNVKYPPMSAPTTPQQAVQQAAAERITPPTTDLQARAQAAFGSQYRPPAAEQAPVAAPVAPQTVPKPMVETPAPAVSGPVAPAAMPEPVATTPAPVVQSTMKPTEKRITFDELAADVVGAKEFGIVHDIKNKTRTEPGASPDTMPNDMRGVLPKDVKWEKSVEHWLPDGSDVAFTEYYTAKTTKNSPVYKYVEPETGDGVLYKQGTGDNWTKVDSMKFPVPKGVLKATEGRAAVQAALDSGKQATIKYKTSAGIITEHVNRTAKVKFDSDLEMNHTIVRPDSTTLFGTKKSSGIPVKIEMMDLSTQSANPEFIKVFDNSKPKSPVLMATYDQNGTPTSTPASSKKKAPPGVIEMIPGEGGPKSLAGQFKENYKYIGDNEKMPDGSKHYGNAHYHGSRTNPLTPEEVRGRRMTNEIKDKGSEQTYWVKQEDTVKQIYSDGPDLTITVYDAKTGKSFEYKRGESYDGKTEYSTVTYDKNGSEISHTPRKDTADLSQWPEEFRKSYF